MKFREYTMESVLDSIIDYRGKTPKKSINGIPTLSAKSVKNNHIDYSECYFISESEYKKFMVRGFPQKGDVLLTTEAPMGLVARLDRNGVAVAQRLLTIRGKKDVLDNGYLLYLLQSPYGQSLLKAKETGTTVTGIKQSEFRKIVLRIPDLETQKKIAKVLSALDDKIELNNQINKNLEEQAQSIFKRCFIDNEESLHWENATFSNLVVSTISGDWGKDSPSGNNKEEVYCIRGADIPEVQKGTIGKMPIRYILPKNLLSKQLSAGDIVVEISGGSPTQSTGRCASITQSLLNRYGGKMICTNFCRAIKVVPGYSAFVYYYLRYLYDKGTFFAYENGTTGIKNLDLTGFLETESIMIPPKAKIEEFDMLSQSIFCQIYANGKQNDGLSKLRDTLLPKLMSGKIDVDNVEI